MTVYIEYAFIENFLLDGVLLWLSLRLLKLSVRPLRILLSSAIGGVFALLFPLLSLPNGLSLLLKISVGVQLCLLANGEKRNFLLFALTFFALSFLFGGALLPLLHGTKNAPAIYTPIGFLVLSALVLRLVKKLYARRSAAKRLYDCKIKAGGRSVAALGYYDSGNTAKKGGVPVCFLSAEIAYELFEKQLLYGEGEGQVCDEMAISTMSGEKTVRLLKGCLEIKTDGGTRVIEEVYFSPTANMIQREYKVLLHASFEEGL